MAIYLRRTRSILVSQYLDISLDLYLRLPDSSNSFSTSDTSSASGSDYEQSRHRKQHGTKHSRCDSSSGRSHIEKNK